MKSLVRFLLLLVCVSSLARAAGSASAPAIPATPYLLSEKRADGKPNVTYYYFIHRDGGLITPVFSSREAAERFRASFPADKAADLTPVTFTRSIVEGMVQHGASVLLDPASPTEGGTPLKGEASAGPDELRQIYEADQADRNPGAGRTIDWKAVNPRDEQRRERVLELYRDGALKTGADFYHAAMVLQHAQQPEEFLLAHEFCIAALIRGDSRAQWLAAATEDRFLMSIDRPQRFGTQSRALDGQPMKLYRTDDGVTDALRQVFGVPSLAGERQRAEAAH
jgi:hypothetical protein